MLFGYLAFLSKKIPGLTKDPGGVPLWVPLLTGSSFDGFLFTAGGG